MKKSKLLVTGAGGFIGTGLIRELKQRRCQLVYLSRQNGII